MRAGWQGGRQAAHKRTDKQTSQLIIKFEIDRLHQ
jgi:hypothetical protein